MDKAVLIDQHVYNTLLLRKSSWGFTGKQNPVLSGPGNEQTE